MSDALVPVKFHVNGRAVDTRVPDDLPIIDFLQEALGLSGTRLCCGIGVCKACTVAARRAPAATGRIRSKSATSP